MDNDICPDVTGGRGVTPLHRKYQSFDDVRPTSPDPITRLAIAAERVADVLERIDARIDQRVALQAQRNWPI